MDKTITAVTYTEDPATSVRNQFIAAIIVCMGTFSYGSAVGWISPSLETLQGEESPLGSPLTAAQQSVVASLFCVGGLVGSLLTGVLADRLGRRWTGLILAIPTALCWILKLSARSVTLIYVARLLAGVGGGGSLMLAPTYSIEIASLAVRGTVGSITMLSTNSGVLFIFVIGAYLPYDVVLWLNLALPVIFAIAFFFMPETPVYLVKREKYDEAAKAIAWLRNTSTEDPATVGVLENLKQEALLASKPGPSIQNSDYIQDEKTIGTSLPVPGEDVPNWKFFITSRVTMKAFGMCLIIIFVHVWVGAFTIISFVSEIFADAGSSLSPNNGAIVVGVLQLAGTSASTVVVDRLGRKVLFSASCLLLGVSLCTLGFYFFFKSLGNDMTAYGWIPIAAVSLGSFSECAGIGPVPFVIINEVFMVQASGIATTIINVWLWLMLSLQTQFYKSAEEAMGSHGLFWAFTSVCIFGAVYTIIFVPETKGKTLEEILGRIENKSSKKMKNADLMMGADNPVYVDDELPGFQLRSISSRTNE